MIPILFDSSVQFAGSNTGYGVLVDCIRCEVVEEVNGTFECEFDYPMTGGHFARLISGGYCIGVSHDHNGDVQLFDIYRYEARTDGIVTFYAAHVSYRLAQQIGSGVYAGIPQTYTDLTSLLSAIVTLEIIDRPGITFGAYNYSNITTIGETRLPLRFNSRSQLLNREDMGNITYNGIAYENRSILRRFGGEFKFSENRVEYYSQRGQDRGVQIRYGKNLTEVNRDYDEGGIISRVYPVWIDSAGNWVSFDAVTSPHLITHTNNWMSGAETMMSGDNILEFNVPVLRSSVYDLSSQFQNQPTAQEARTAAAEYMSKNSTWRPADNITLSFVDLYDSPDYASIKAIEKCDVGDLVSVYFAELGIVAEGVEIMSGRFDVLGERFLSMELNTIRATLAQVILDSIGGK